MGDGLVAGGVRPAGLPGAEAAAVLVEAMELEEQRAPGSGEVKWARVAWRVGLSEQQCQAAWQRAHSQPWTSGDGALPSVCYVNSVNV